MLAQVCRAGVVLCRFAAASLSCAQHSWQVHSELLGAMREPAILRQDQGLTCSLMCCLGVRGPSTMAILRCLPSITCAHAPHKLLSLHVTSADAIVH